MRLLAVLLTLFLMLPLGASTQEVANQEHEVVAGETLWSLARTYLGSPYEWRQIWDLNKTAVPDPTQMQPGQMLHIPAGATNTPALPGDAAVQDIQVNTVPRGGIARPMGQVRTSNERAPGRTVFYGSQVSEATGSQGFVVRDDDTNANVFLPAVAHDVFYSAGWLIPEDVDAEHVGQITAFASGDEGRVRRWGALRYDRMRLDFGGAAAQVGDEFIAFRVERSIEFLGQVIVPSGVLTVSRVDEAGAVAVLTQEYDRVLVGDLLVPLPAFPLTPGIYAQPTREVLDAQITGFRMGREVQPMGAIAFLDKGADAGVRLGDEFEVLSPRVEGWDRDTIGSIQVVGVRPEHSVVRISDIDAPLFRPGVGVRLVKRMPKR